MICTKAFIRGAVLALALALLAPWALAQNEIAVFKSARSDYFWLLKQPQAKKIYQNWQGLADRFAGIYTAHPYGSLADKALFWQGRVHTGAYRQFKRQEDFHKAVDVYRRLTNRFPKSRLSDDAQFQIGRLFETKGDLKQAYVDYLRVTVNFPRGDQVKAAKVKLDQLEKKLFRAREKSPPRKRKPGVRPNTLAVLNGISHWSNPNYTRVVITLERAVPYTRTLIKKDLRHGKPRRLFIDLRGAMVPQGFKDKVAVKDGLLTRIRTAQFNKDTARVVLDIRHLRSFKTFTLDNPFRLVVDCFGVGSKLTASAKKTESKGKAGAKLTYQKPSRKKIKKRRVSRGKAKEKPPQVSLAGVLGLGIKKVVIDPGHGGKDPGARYRGLWEKRITLDVAKRMAPKLRKLLGCRVLFTRTRDRFVSLESRTAYANTHDADIFISLHTNAAPSHRLAGLETYFLNLASDEASLRVAARENATTRRSISDLQVILNDLMLNSKINESNRLARAVHKQMLARLRRHYKTRSLGVKQAPFVVLIGARMPSVLVEMGFITNPGEHRLLASSRFRDRMAQGIANGIASYAKELKQTRH